MKRARGFTLIEILLVLMIVGVLAMSALPSMRLHLANADIRAVAEETRSGIELARTEAIRRNSTVRFDFNGNGWTVTAVGAGAGGVDLIVAQRPSRTTQIALAADVNTISFNGSGWTTPFGTGMNVNLQAPGAGQCRPTGGINCLNLLVAGGGLVRSCDPSAAAGASTACN
jgi:type IV fimbrial biogenesis protein FimT